jgi:HlyD family secretion protein
VTYLAAEGEFTPRNLQTKEKRVEEVFRCKVRVDDPSGRLRPGMVCDITFTRPGAGAAR